MEVINILVLFSVFIVNICADDILNYDDEIDSIMGDILNGDYDTRVGEEHESENVKEDEPQFSDGIWKCGNCSNVDESKILFSETLDLDSNYEDTDTGLELQIGFSVSNMRCITIETGAVNVRRVSGACAEEDVTLSFVQNSHIEVKIYE